MLNRLAGVIATAMALLLVPFAMTACASERETVEPTRVMLMGDSVTQGATGDFTWRYFLWNALASSPEEFDFVGPRNTLHKAGTESTDEAPGVGYANPNFDRDHAARWGMGVHWIDQMTNMSTGATWDGNSLGAGNDVTNLMTNYNPDVVVDLLGYNDLNPHGWDFPAAAVAAKQREVIMEARAINPTVTMVLGRVGHQWVQGQKAADYNAALAALAAELDTPAARVVLVPVALDSEGDTYDRAHPNVRGETKIAEKVRSTLASVGVGVGSTPVVIRQPTPEVAPRLGRVTGVKASTIKTGARVRWVNAANSTAVEVWKRASVKKANRNGWKGWSAWRKVTTAPAPAVKFWDARIAKGKTPVRHQFKVRPVGVDGAMGAWSSASTTTNRAR